MDPLPEPAMVHVQVRFHKMLWCLNFQIENCSNLILKTFLSKEQTPKTAATVFKSIMESLQQPGEWPLDTLVHMGTLFGGPSQNSSSDVAHIKFQNLSNSSKKFETRIRQLCIETFEKYHWKLNKVGFSKNWAYSKSSFI